MMDCSFISNGGSKSKTQHQQIHHSLEVCLSAQAVEKKKRQIQPISVLPRENEDKTERGLCSSDFSDRFIMMNVNKIAFAKRSHVGSIWHLRQHHSVENIGK